ncbi:MAG: saccharopine dehydrogenase NADP-binding domain-containing protein, partial [Deltaproteobacteria bacterium]|nr:saccharopine dehydrogenase NADP-binding domain-containing protein [Deltaproteobacteria bacterium]
MGRVLIVGAGGVGGVVAHKCAQFPEVFSEIVLASRTLEKCERIRRQLSRPIQIDQVDAGSSREMTALIRKHAPDVVIQV